MLHRIGMFCLLLTALVSSAPASAAGPSHLWSQRFGSTGSDWAASVAVDVSGNVVVAGAFEGSVDFGGGLLTNGGGDFFLAKYNASGGHVWSQRLVVTGGSISRAIAIDASGNVFLTGQFYGTANLGGSDLTSVGTNYDLFLAKFDASGAHIWSQRFGSANTEEPNDIAVDASGNVIMVGAFWGSVDFGGGALTSIGQYSDMFVAKYDATGAHQWSKRFGARLHDEAFSVAGDAFGNVIITGYFFETVDFGGGGLTSADWEDIFIAKYDAAGVHQWSQRFGSATTVQEAGRAVAVDGLGNLVVAGQFGGATNFGGDNLTSAGNSDAFLAKYDADGVHQWSRSFGNEGWDNASDVALDASGSVFLRGYCAETVDFGGGDLTSAGGLGAILAKYSSDGAHQWSRQLGGSSSDPGRLAVDALGDAVVVGGFYDVVDFGGGELTSAGLEDVFIAKYGDHPLPVLITAFEATPKRNAVDVTWSLWTDEALDRLALHRSHGKSNAVVIASWESAIARAYTDASVDPGETYQYELVVHTAGGEQIRSQSVSATVPRLGVTLSQNFPNPFNPQTTIEYAVDATAQVSIEIYDASGALVSRMNQGYRDAGTYRAEWNARDATGRPLASGVYFYRLSGVKNAETRKMVLLR